MQVVSASRRTDIPAGYAEWFLNRVRAGFARVPNPFNPRQVTTISLRPDEVACLVFWTRDPRPLLPYLDELDERGFRSYFQVTITGLPQLLEPGVPTEAAAVGAIRELAGRLGPRRVIWRYDPLLLSDLTPPATIAATFDRLSRALEGSVVRVMVSFLRPYRQVTARLRRLEREHHLGLRGLSRELPAAERVERRELLARLAEIAVRRGLRLLTCAEADDYSPQGVPPGACIDGELIRELWGIDVPARKDPGQRPECRCIRSVDLGIYGTCRHGCRYCYAAADRTLTRGRHDPASPILFEQVGLPSGGEKNDSNG
jgi:hypothetical protein